MAQVTITKIVEGPQFLIAKFDFLGDGSGELKASQILSPTDGNPPQPIRLAGFKVMQAWYQLVWFDVLLTSGTLNPCPLWTFARDSHNHIDFRSFGGLTERPSIPVDADDGVLRVTTNGLVLGSQGSIILELRKTTVQQ